jgi:hypothetical protein
MKNKNVYYVVAVILLIIIGAIWYSARLNKSQPQTGAQSQTGAQPQVVVGQTQNNKTPPKISEMPKFILGSVSKIAGTQITLTVGTEEKVITTNAKTEIISQVKDGTGYKNIPATFGDIKIASKIVVYYGQNTGSVYTADKIQILNF